MTLDNLYSLMPLALVAAAIVAALLASAARRGRGPVLSITIGGLLCALVAIPFVSLRPPYERLIAPLLIMDDYTLFLAGLLLFASLAVSLVSRNYLKIRKSGTDEFYILQLISTLGAMVVVASDHFAAFFLGLEALTVPLYGLIAYSSSGKKGVEAGIKYLILSSVSSSFLLFGMALLYARLGVMEFSGVARLIFSFSIDPMLWAGIMMMITGIGFKLAIVPFHMWTPDVYEGAPAPVTAFIATVSKGAVFALLLRFFINIDFSAHAALFGVFALLAVASMFTGNLLALFQDNVKRLLAYSSIAHFGYILVAFLSMGSLRVGAILFYLAQYFVTTVAAFSIIGLLSTGPEEKTSIEDYKGLYSRHPWLAGAFTLTLLSLAGMPLTAGFMAKFFVITAGMSSALVYLVLALLINSAIGLFYYLRVAAALFAAPFGIAEGPLPKVSRLSCFVIAVLAALLIFWGILPSSLIDMVFGMGAAA
ncbi:MAG TPA: NADH-quinone oxidoreductase subunit N [Syntrophorhabdaceae bacterium]